MIKKIKFIWNEFIYGGHLLSLGSASIIFTTSLLLNKKITWDSLFLVYLSAQIVYLYYQFTDFNKDILTNPERTKHIKKYLRQIPFIITILTIILISTLVYLKNYPSTLFFLFLIAFTLFYNQFFKKITKTIPGFKNFFISFGEAILVFFYAIHYGFAINFSFILIFTFILLRWLVNTAFLDIKDIENDKKENLSTLIIFLGQKKLFLLLKTISIIALIPIIYGIIKNLFPIYSVIILFTIPYTFYYLKKQKNKTINPDFLYNTLVNAEFILWTISIILAKKLI